MTEDWLGRWAEGRTGWHESAGNAALKQHWNVTGKRVLVPLSGKSVDLLWLAVHGNRVVGVELSELGAQSFFQENWLAYDRAGKIFRARDVDVEVHCGDFFAFDDEPFDAHYDRAAIIALPKDLRPAYARKVDRLLADDAFRLVITVEYDQSIVDGPPYSVTGDEVLSYWTSLVHVDATDDLDTSPPRFREAGLTEIREVVWRTPGAD